MLALDAQDRMTVGDILVHSWICEGHESPLLTRQPPLGKLFPVVPNSFIVNYMTRVFDFQEDDIFYSVLERKMNAVAATYHLLQKHFEEGHSLVGVPAMAARISPFQPDYLGNNQNEPTDASVNTELPSIRKEKSSLVTSKPSVNLFNYTSSKYSEYKPRDIKRNLSLRTRSNKFRLGKYTKAEEEGGLVPDFILTYAHNEGIDYEIPDRRYEWEQSFIVTKHGSVKGEKNQRMSQGGDSFSNSRIKTEENGKNISPSRNTTSIGRQSQVATPVNSCVDEEIYHAKSISGGSEPTDSTKRILVKSCEDPCNERSWSSYHRQKSRLARGMSVTVKREHNVAYKAPISAPKTLTPREAKSYFDEITRARVVGTGNLNCSVSIPSF